METIKSSSMTEWKARQHAYHCMTANEDRPDDLNKHEILHIERWQIGHDVLWHFKELPNEFRYPSKSYVVAIVYARLLSEFFGGHPSEYLEDPELLFGNDPYYKTYSEDSELYDHILQNVSWKFDLNQGTPAHVMPYFFEEFMITESEKEEWRCNHS